MKDYQDAANLAAFIHYLRSEEREASTIEKYLRDVRGLPGLVGWKDDQ